MRPTQGPARSLPTDLNLWRNASLLPIPIDARGTTVQVLKNTARSLRLEAYRATNLDSVPTKSTYAAASRGYRYIAESRSIESL